MLGIGGRAGEILRGAVLPTPLYQGSMEVGVANRVEREGRSLRPARDADEDVIGTVPAAKPPPVMEEEAAATLVNSGMADMEAVVGGTGGDTAVTGATEYLHKYMRKEGAELASLYTAHSVCKTVRCAHR